MSQQLVYANSAPPFTPSGLPIWPPGQGGASLTSPFSFPTSTSSFIITSSSTAALSNHTLPRTTIQYEPRDSLENTPLLRAIIECRESSAKELLLSGANPNHQNLLGQTPLYLSLISGLSSLVVNLLQCGANPNVCTVEGASALHLASSLGNDTIVMTLVQAGAFVNKVDENGESPLHWAAREGKESTVAQLISSGADVNVTNDEDETPLNLALVLGEFGVARVLVDSGAAPSMEDLEIARGQPQVIQLFQGVSRTNISSPSAAFPRVSPSSISTSTLNQRFLYSPLSNDCKPPNGIAASGLPSIVANLS